MGMDNRFQLGTYLVNGTVKREFGGGLVFPEDCPVGFDAIDIVGSKGTFIDSGRSDPNITLIIDDRNISTGSGSHPIFVDATDNQNNLIAWVH
jgi:hypothetical protein